MSLAEHLLDQARHLATRDAQGRPRQANLRRAVSSAYYALFHYLIDQASRSAVGGAPERRALRGVVARAFDHSVMRRVATSFAAGTLPSKLQPGLGAATIPPDLQKVADAFRSLQEARHTADYDVMRKLERQEVLVLIGRAEQAIRQWAGVRDSAAGRLFLAALLIGDRVRE